MAKPMIHARSSAKRFGGKPEDYMPIHEKMDSSKASHPDLRHRCLYHHSLGPYMMQDLFGVQITNSDGNKVQVRDIAEQHILEDMGFIPSFSDYMYEMQIQPWMAGKGRPPQYERQIDPAPGVAANKD